MKTMGWALLVLSLGVCAACGSDSSSDDGSSGGATGAAGGGGSGGAAGSGGTSGSGTTGGTAGSGGAAATAGAAGTAGSGGGAPCDDGSGWELAWQQKECQAVDLINEARVAGGTCNTTVMPPVAAAERHQLLTEIARSHAKDMGDNNYFNWNKPGGEEFPDWITSAGFTGMLSGQVLMVGPADSPEAVALALSDLSTCLSAMDADANYVAVGHYEVGGAYYWVIFFASEG